MDTVTTVRLPLDLRAALNLVAKEEHLDKSTVFRQLLDKAVNTWKKEKAVERYSHGTCSLEQASSFSGISTWDFLNVLKQHNTSLNYDEEELEKDLKNIQWKR